MKKSEVFIAQITGNRLSFKNYNKVKQFLYRFEGQWVDVVIRAQTLRRTVKSNAYYWGVVINLISDHTGFTPEECHTIFKEKFLQYEKEHEGRIYIFTRSTADLDMAEFAIYLDKVILFAEQELGVRIPLPGESEIDY